MKTTAELRDRAQAIAESHFYCDEDCEIAWQPFEYWPDEDLIEACDSLTDSVYRAMLWAQS
jgi:hypothetical protein